MENPAPPDLNNNSGDAHRPIMLRCIQALSHAVQCRSESCSLLSCQKMKRVVLHTRGCQRKIRGGCRICKQLMALCCNHAKHCQENVCPVPFCLYIKQKLHQKQLQALTHALECRSESCSLLSCQKMKGLIQHTKGCQRRTNGGCPICKQLIVLCSDHTNHCQENVCPVPFCLYTKQKLHQMQLQRRLRQAQMSRRWHHHAQRG